MGTIAGSGADSRACCGRMNSEAQGDDEHGRGYIMCREGGGGGRRLASDRGPPPIAASGEALRIDGEPDVPDWRPSPMHGSDVMPCLMSSAGGCMFTTSAEPG